MDKSCGVVAVEDNGSAAEEGQQMGLDVGRRISELFGGPLQVMIECSTARWPSQIASAVIQEFSILRWCQKRSAMLLVDRMNLNLAGLSLIHILGGYRHRLLGFL